MAAPQKKPKKRPPRARSESSRRIRILPIRRAIEGAFREYLDSQRHRGDADGAPYIDCRDEQAFLDAAVRAVRKAIK